MEVADSLKHALEERRFTDVERDGDVRTAYDRDLARIIHSAAFRRLQGKTQVMSVGETDFIRTRLTHTLEVAQIGESLLNALQARHQNETPIPVWLPDTALIRAACLAHDLGHPPYGHSGERALHQCLVNKGGSRATLRPSVF